MSSLWIALASRSAGTSAKETWLRLMDIKLVELAMWVNRALHCCMPSLVSWRFRVIRLAAPLDRLSRLAVERSTSLTIRCLRMFPGVERMSKNALVWSGLS